MHQPNQQMSYLYIKLFYIPIYPGDVKTLQQKGEKLKKKKTPI